MADRNGARRANQKLRTRKDLLEAAARLVREGRKPTLEEVAEAALVSRATAYRYFLNVEALLLEASLDVAAPRAEAVFEGASDHDPLERLAYVDAAFHEMVLQNEAPLRLMLAQSLKRSVRAKPDDATPARQNRRSALIEAALAPGRDGLDPSAAEMLELAAAMLVGTEGMIVLKDVLRLDDAKAREVKRWALAALVQAARLKPAP